MDPALVAEEIERRGHDGRPLPTAIEVVHLLGHPADIEPLVRVCDEHGIALVEDAAEALGARYRGGPLDGRHVGTIGRIGCFSFNGNKVITTGGGGMLVTDDSELARRAKHLTTQARLPGLAYQHDEVGYNYRLSNLAAAMGVAQLEQLDGFLAAKRRIAARYDDAFRDLPGVAMPPDAPWADPERMAVFDPPSRRRAGASVLDELVAAGIGARPVWTPLHRMSPFAGAPIIGDGSVATRSPSTAVSLPSSVQLEPADQATRHRCRPVGRDAASDPMIAGGRVLGLIPARGGSKGVPRKNLRLLGGKPLLQWTVEAARASRHIDRLVLSTDDDEIAELGISLGLEVPFRRPAEASSDDGERSRGHPRRPRAA